MQGTLPSAIAEDLEQSVLTALKRAKQQRQPEYLRRQGMMVGVIAPQA